MKGTDFTRCILLCSQPVNSTNATILNSYKIWSVSLSINNLVLSEKTPKWINAVSSSSSCRAISTDILDPLSPPLPIVHCFRQIFRAISRIGTELLYISSSWSSRFCSAMWSGPQEYITYELVSTSPAVSRMSGSSNFDSFRDEW